MQCVVMLLLMTAVASQRIFRYDGRVVDLSQTTSPLDFVPSRHNSFTSIQPVVVEPQPDVMEAPVFLQPQPVIRPPQRVIPQPNILFQSRPELMNTAFIQSSQLFRSPLPAQPEPSTFSQSLDNEPSTTGFRPQPIFLSRQQTRPLASDVLIQSQPPQSQPSVFLAPQPSQPEFPMLLPPQPTQPQPLTSNVFASPQQVLGSDFPTSAAVSIPVQTTCNPVARPLVDQVVGRESWHFSWCHQPDRTFTWLQAQDYCSSLGRGFLPVNIENRFKDNHVNAVMSAHRKTSIWTSGNRLRTALWSWSTGVSSQYTNWSSTGRLGLPQPDNAEGDEFCLAVRYSYNDGAGWHDEPCTSSSLVVCQSTSFV